MVAKFNGQSYGHTRTHGGALLWLDGERSPGACRICHILTGAQSALVRERLRHQFALLAKLSQHLHVSAFGSLVPRV